MLQRAASNAYSWWWTSHIRMKQGKWLQQNLDDMEEKVKDILKVIEEDADSFAKRAEMYYKKRPELITFVEEFYRAYRALAERYEHISGELQNANNTIANIFPDKVHLAMEDDDDENLPKDSRIDHGKAPKAPENPKFKISIKDVKKSLPLKQKKSQAKRTCPQRSKDGVQEEIDQLQKGILILQTEKEFVKSSYETGISKYWDIEKQIEDMQEKICSLQDESDESTVIEDNDARALMTASALKSCEDTLLQLQEQQKRSTEEVRVESKRVKGAEEKLKAFKERYLHQHIDNQEIDYEAKITEPSSKNFEEDVCYLKQKRLELESLCEKVKDYFEMNSTSSFSVVELAEMIDELVTKVINLESAVSSQNAQIKRLRSETDELQKHLQSLEEDKMSLIDGSKNLSDKVRGLEEELHGIQVLRQSVEDQSYKLQTDFTELCRNLDNLSEKLETPEKNEVEIMGVPQVDEGVVLNVEPHKESDEQEDMWNPVEDSTNSKDKAVELEGKTQDTQDLDVHNKAYQENHFQSDLNVHSKNLQDPHEDEGKNKNAPQAEGSVLNAGSRKQNEEQTDSPNWRNLFINGLEDREKILFTEYTSILRNYMETKSRLSDMEKKNQESLFEIMIQIQELKNANTNKDVEIQSLKQKLSIHQKSPDDSLNNNMKNSGDIQHTKTGSSTGQWKNMYSEFQKRSSSRPMPRSLGDLLTEQNTDFATRSKELNDPPAEEDVQLVLNKEPHVPSPVEEKFRRDIDGLLQDNLEFWFRFSTSSIQIQKYQKKIQDIQEGLLKQINKKKEIGTNAVDPAVKSEASPIEKNLRELKDELSNWLEQNASLKDELRCRFSSLCKIQEEISRVSKMNYETDRDKFTAQQAVKFLGEVLNMKQENKKVADELQAGLYQVRGLQLEVEKTLSKLNENIDMSGSKSDRHHHQARHSTSWNKVPLRSFLFGTKPKKSSIFSCMNPALQKQYSDMKAAGGGPPM